jgi:hypothetical protein
MNQIYESDDNPLLARNFNITKGILFLHPNTKI